jgi:hypothetical protein
VPETPFVGGEAFLPSQPTENLALEGGSGSPDLVCQIISLQMPERIGIETFVRQLSVSEAARANIRGVRAQNHRAKLVG